MSPSFRPVRYPKLQIFVEMQFRTNLQPLNCSSHVLKLLSQKIV